MSALDAAWSVLKSRQTRLSEFDPHWEDPEYGRVTHFHGTTENLRPSIQAQGLLAGENQAFSQEGDSNVYASPNPYTGKEYAMMQSSARRQPPTMFGIRGEGLESDTPHEDYSIFGQRIPPQRLVHMPNLRDVPTWVHHWPEEWKGGDAHRRLQELHNEQLSQYGM